MKEKKSAIYPIECWTITESRFLKENNYRNETAFALSNGYIGTRGTFEEAYDFDIDTGMEGNFLNGFYESEGIRYGEANFGSPLLSQSLLNLPNLKETHIEIGEEWFSMDSGTIEDYSRVLSMRDGTLCRKIIWISPTGKKVQLTFERLVSFKMKNIIASRITVKPLNYTGEIRFVSKLQADVENHTRKNNPIVDYGPFGRKLEPLKIQAEKLSLYYEGITQNSRLIIGCGSFHKITSGQEILEEHYEKKALEASLTVAVEAHQNEEVVLEKMIGYSTGQEIPLEELQPFINQVLTKAMSLGYEKLEDRQRICLDRFWERADIKIEGQGSTAIEQGIHFNLFHIFQSAGSNGHTGMGAKGLTGEGYEGHYFWDTEMYVLPVLIFTEPEMAKNLLDYRYEKLDKARDRARVLGHEKGALFPWRTINGEEASTYYPLGTAQYHINADIAYALNLYLQATGDVAYLKNKGAEILIETARIWADVGCFAECRNGQYCICDVTGPDEYNVLVDNNFYTNLMAREHLRSASAAVKYLKQEDPACWAALKEKLDFSEDELELWDEIVEKMYFPYDEKRGVYLMDDGFMMRKPWDESKIPEEKRAWLYENYHPLFIMRHRMSKQADAILALYLHSNLFTKEEIKRNYDFYQEVTLHHSSLSTCIFGIVASDIGYDEEAYRYFYDSVRMDLDDHYNNLYTGIHAANMAGTWQFVINGFAGMRCQNSLLRFEPHLPKEWDSYSFRVEYRGNLLNVKVQKGQAEFTLLEGSQLVCEINGHEVHIEKEGDTYVEKI